MEYESSLHIKHLFQQGLHPGRVFFLLKTAMSSLRTRTAGSTCRPHYHHHPPLPVCASCIDPKINRVRRDCEGGPNAKRNSSWFYFGVAGGSANQVITMVNDARGRMCSCKALSGDNERVELSMSMYRRTVRKA